jgi:hypothetical protein
MGKRGRLVCHQLCSMYGAPGATLCPPPAFLTYRSKAPALLHAINTWQYAAAATRLEPPQRARPLTTYDPSLLNATFCRALATALPSLRSLKWHALYPNQPASSDAGAAPIMPHTALTSLQLQQAPRDLCALAAFAPHLRELSIARIQDLQDVPDGALTWLGLVALRSSLQHLDVELDTTNSDFHTPALLDAMEDLQGLAHLGLTLPAAPLPSHLLPADKAAMFTQALAALPLLRSLKLFGFRVFGTALGPALEGLSLQYLELGEPDFGGEPPLQLGGCLPSLAAVRGLEHLKLYGELVNDVGAMQHMGAKKVPGLEALEVHGMRLHEALPGLCSVLDCAPSLTMLSFKMCPKHHLAADTTLPDMLPLLRTLSQHTQLRRVESLGPVDVIVRWLRDLEPCHVAQLTSLELSRATTDMLATSLGAVASLTSLKKLVFEGALTTPGRRQACINAVQQLPVLEDVEVGYGRWSHREVKSLLPPPARLKRLLLRWTSVSVPPQLVWLGQKGERQLRDAVAHFAKYGVDMQVVV